MKFKYTAFDKNGKKLKGVVEADDLKSAKLKLKNLIILEIKPLKKFEFSFSKKINKKELSKLFLTLGLYLRASIPLKNAIELSKNQFDDTKIVKFLDYLKKEINEGKSFFNAIESQKILSIPIYIKNALKVGEEGGKLDVILIEMAKLLKNEDKIFFKAKEALIYPFFIILVALFMVYFMLTSVVPKIVKVFENLNQTLPDITLFVIKSGNFLKQNVFLILFFLIIFITIFLVFYKKIYKFRLFVDSLLLKIPVVKKIIISKELGKFSYLVYILNSSGVNYITSLKLAANTVENEKIKSVFKNALDEVIEGKKFSISLSKAGFDFDKSFVQAVALAEETGEIENILKNISEIYLEENNSLINTFLSLIEPLLIIFIGVVIGIIVTALLLPIFSMNFFK